MFLALQCFATDSRATAILLCLDNVTAIAFPNRMGGTHSTLLCNLAVDIWKRCLDRSILIHAEHLPGSQNFRADWQSRHVTDSSDWALHWSIFFGAGRQARTLLSQPIRFSHQCTAPAILQLEAGPFSHGSGRTIHPMERAQLLHVSPICTNPSLLGQAGRGGSNSSNDCPSMAEPNLVPSAAQDSDRPPHALTTGSEHCNRPRGPESLVGDGRTPHTGHLAHLRGYYRTAGLSERVISILRKSWRHSTKSSYANACRQWVCWCLEWGC